MNIRLFLYISVLIMNLCGGASAQTDTIFLDRWHFYKQGIVGVYDVEGNFNPGRYTWSILTPSQSHLPALPAYVDPNQIQPFPEVPVRSPTRNLSTLIYKNCDDSDRCEFLFPQAGSEVPAVAKPLVVRLKGIHAPHVKASCEQETLLGNQAKNLIEGLLSSAHHIQLMEYYQNGKEMKGRLVADGQDLSELLVNQGLAVKIEGNKKDWCS
ncbi:MAG: thermonuclease family protein [Nitrospirota bacterium]|nr:MAG: thermonuclease family protein [Nitrospirota bacterium]